ncbi:hypothetical protein ZEAMMB73_Zm00001d026388 [Zea mays]|uniref:Uncharacterized protein n=1 Tax=Zea mays TaxID=4577 RepID=A0A1D6JFA3_MAIZE|nr:hypothetical protein ZEAMMB73_Zm00001d026388 [Zea mays]
MAPLRHRHATTLLAASAPLRLLSLPHHRPRLLIAIHRRRRRSPPRRVSSPAAPSSSPSSSWPARWLEGSLLMEAQNDKFSGKIIQPNRGSKKLQKLIIDMSDKEADAKLPSIIPTVNIDTFLGFLNFFDLIFVKKFFSSASMANRVFCSSRSQDLTLQQLTSDATIEVAIDIPFPF